jgi:hypothetical protein
MSLAFEMGSNLPFVGGFDDGGQVARMYAERQRHHLIAATATASCGNSILPLHAPPPAANNDWLLYVSLQLNYRLEVMWSGFINLISAMLARIVEWFVYYWSVEEIGHRLVELIKYWINYLFSSRLER